MDLKKFCADLKQLKIECGGPTLLVLQEKLNLSTSRIGEILNGKTTSVDFDFVEGFVVACRRHATDHDRTPKLSTDVEYWRRAHGLVEQARASLPAEPQVSPWADAVENHDLCDLVDGEKEGAREQAVELAEQLVRRVRSARTALDGDPWLDQTLASRVSVRVVGLCVMADLKLMPLEAAVLTLAPLVYEAQWTCSAAGKIGLRPTDLRQTGEPEREEYERFLRGQQESRLVARAEQHGLKDRKGAPTEIGWWLFHRWLAGRAETSGSVLNDLPGSRLDDTLNRLVRLLKLSPADLRDPHRLELRAVHPHHGITAHAQDVRERLVGLIFVVAHSLAIELTALSSTIVEHLGIPEPVRLDELRASLEKAEWSPIPVGVGLVAQCTHEAVLEALREHAARTDAVLGAVRTVATDDHNTLEPLRSLPAHASGDGVEPLLDRDNKPAFAVPVVRFRLEETRVRELLMGKELYRDQSLAIRELYQNALDACRYRQARYDFLHATRGMRADWTGSISFDQGIEPETGRHYLRCVDNGVGMGFAELRDVFSQAGIRFADRPEFLEEQAQWRERGVRFFPNSRFGIGAMSYFMLADEIEVTTCRMDRRGGDHGPELQVNIVGPGHLFRIKETWPPGREPGTKVKLYLRDGAAAPSCADTLWRLLGIAEFYTQTDHYGQLKKWPPGVYEPRDLEGAIQADGKIVRHEPTDQGQVLWCEFGGGLLVDGLLVQTDERNGVLARDEDDEHLCGAIINLTGAAAPRLTVNRSHVVGSVSATVEGLILGALPSLLDTPQFLTGEWLGKVYRDSPRVADLMVSGAIEGGCRIELEAATTDAAVAGFLIEDEDILVGARTPSVDRLRASHLLWRLVALRRGALPLEAAAAGDLDILPALPSDAALIEECLGDKVGYDVIAPGGILSAARRLGMSPREAAARLRALGCLELDPYRFPVGPSNTAEVNLVSVDLDGEYPWLSLGKPVAPWHVVAAARHFGSTVDDLISRLDLYGFDITRAVALSNQIQDADLILVSVDGDKVAPWLLESEPVPIGHVVHRARALGQSIDEVVTRLEELNFQVPAVPSWACEADLDLLRKRRPLSWFRQGEMVDPEVLSLALSRWECDRPEAIARYAELGLVAPALEEFDDFCRGLPVECLIFGEPLPIAELVKLSINRETAPWTLAAELRRRGIKVPQGFFDSDGYDEVDRALLNPKAGRRTTRRFDDSGGEPLQNEDVPLGYLMDASVRHVCSPREAAERLGRMGFEVPDLTDWPELLFAADYKLVSRQGDGYWPWLDSGDQISLGHLVIMSELVGMAPEQVRNRLDALGFEVSQFDNLPERFSPDDVVLFLDDSRNVVLVPSEPVSMSALILTCMRLKQPLAETAERLGQFGVQVADLALELPKLLERLPRRRNA